MRIEKLSTGLAKMSYPLQFDVDNHCFGVKALLRCPDLRYGKVSLPLIIDLMKEINQLQVISMNVTVDTLKSEVFANFLRYHPVSEGRYCIEVTEQNMLLLGEAMHEGVKEFKDLGYSQAVDDFSMGSMSLKYYQSNQLEFIKLDGSLVKHVRENESGRQIIQSLLYLTQSMNFTVMRNRWKPRKFVIC